MTREPESIDDDPELTALLRLADAEAAPVAEERLGEIGRRALERFSEGAADEADRKRPRVRFLPKSSDGRDAMKLLTGLAASLAVLGVVWFASTTETSGRDAVFGDVLADLREAETLQLRLARAGDDVDVWVRPADAVRWEESATSYRVARGGTLWEVDETAGDARVQQNPWLGEDGAIDLLALLDIDPQDRAALLKSRPSDVGTYLDRPALVYRRTVSTDEGRLRVQAYVDRTTRQLLGVTAHPAMSRRDSRPVAELRLLAVNPPVDDAKFRVPVRLAESDRVGKVSDLQGTVVLRAVGGRRWTPVCRQLLVQPGDWIRTDVRGANAATVDLTSGQSVIVGPGTLIEITSSSSATLHYGEVQLRRTTQTEGAFELMAERTVTRYEAPGNTVLRMPPGGKLAELQISPTWLQYYEGTSANDSIGSLIVNIDGRTVPLTVGEHHVTVEIRDQIARTTIEETFVNHTDSRMEGTFHFPLPQDASISGFGMWIGGELIEADIVEKQRAREIYETILREKRDPGLLEWTGGNIFKARVFPIEAHSEKRVKIVYTQVLPLQGNRFRYNYGLRSEMLQSTPLRELNLRVLVNSAVPLAAVDSPTHDVRTQLTRHSAQLEFSRQEYTPEKDFEVVCEVDHRENDVVLIPHRRGEDGYFLLQLMPPGGGGDWRRELIPDGKPLEVLLLCDTSGSMDSAMRKAQANFVSTVLASLGDEDRVNVAVCDAETVWGFEDFVAPTPENRETLETFLSERVSLGWTDLDQAFAEVLKKAGETTHVIYVGDGIVSTRSADPSAFVTRLRRLVKERGAEGQRGASGLPTFHTVSVGSAFESVVLNGIAGLGSGSVRQVSGETTPQETAFELLNEIAQPGLKDVRVEIRGLRTAAMYPNRLPNIAAGTQQILVGRYLPEGTHQQGEVVVHATREGKPVRYAATVALADAESGNSFIPRLWARARLEELLMQGSSQQIQDEIIALSEEFHIITPYTSLLVLESDADRDRFGVKRRFRMRDGEQFFAEGRDNATYELRQQQMRMAGNWRLGLRRQILAELTDYGRVLPGTVRPLQLQEAVWLVNGLHVRDAFGMSPMSRLPAISRTTEELSRLGDLANPVSESGPGQLDGDLIAAAMPADARMSDVSPGFPPEELADGGNGAEVLSGDFAGREIHLFLQTELAGGQMARSRLGFAGEATEFVIGGVGGGFGGGGGLFGRQLVGDREWFRRGGAVPHLHFDSNQWLVTLFPRLPVPQSDEVQEIPRPDWPLDALQLSESLLRVAALEELGGGIELRRVEQRLDSDWDGFVIASEQLELWSPRAWMTRHSSSGQQPLVNFVEGDRRGVYSEVFRLGRQRDAVAGDRGPEFLSLNDASLTGLHELYRLHTAEVGREDGRIVLTLTTEQQPEWTWRFTIDPERDVLLEQTTLQEGRVIQRVRFGEFVQVAGLWWATKIEWRDGDDTLTSRIELTVTEHEPEAFERRLRDELAVRESALLLDEPLPRLTDARQRVQEGSATIEDHVAALMFDQSRQQWKEVFARLDSIEQLAGVKPGLAWMRALITVAAGRREEARHQLTELAKQLVAKPGDETARRRQLWEAEFVLTTLYPILDWNEYGRVVADLKPVYEQHPEQPRGLHTWKERQISVDDALGRIDAAMGLAQEMAGEASGNPEHRIRYATRLAQVDPEGALASLRRAMDEPHWDAAELTRLRMATLNLLEAHHQWEEALEFIRETIRREADEHAPWARLLTALVMTDQVEVADETAVQWLSLVEGITGADEASATDLARLNAAIDYALGNGYRLSSSGGLRPKWRQPLYEAARGLAQSADQIEIAKRIVQAGSFSETDEGDRLRGDVLGWLLADSNTLEMARLSEYIRWVLHQRLLLTGEDRFEIRQATEDQWEQIAETLLRRWEEEPEAALKHSVAESVLTILRAQLPSRVLPFVRRMVAEGPEEFRPTYRQYLFNELLSEPWEAEREREALEMIPTLPGAESMAHQKPGRQIAWLLQWTNSMVQQRVIAAAQREQDEGHVDELTRSERAERAAQRLKEAREGVAATLQQEFERLPGGDQARYSQWIVAERMYLLAQLDQEREAILEWAWSLLGDAPPREGDPEELTHEQRHLLALEEQLRQRAWVTVQNFAVRRNAEEPLIARVLAYVDAGIEAGREQNERLAERDEVTDRLDRTLSWKEARIRLLLVLDRPDDLVAALRDWIKEDEWSVPWKVSLGRLLAEQGDFEEAIALFESLAAEDNLSPADRTALADWYLAVNQREKYEQSRIDAYRLVEEWQLSNWLNQSRSRVRDGGAPHEIDVETLLMVRALLEKSSHPESYFWSVRELYTATRDFRLLRMLPHTALGRTQQQTYAALRTLEQTVLREIREEAPADELLAEIERLRGELNSEGSLRGSAVNERAKWLDRRGLDLLEGLVERRAAEVLNQPGPHVAAAVAAWERAFHGEWAEGERLQMAELLQQLGTISQPKLAELQLNQLQVLYRDSEPGTLDRARIGLSCGRLLVTAYERPAEGLALAEAVLNEFRQASGGQVPYEGMQLVVDYSSLLRGVGHYTAAEELLLGELEVAASSTMRSNYEDHLNALYEEALRNQGRVSPGEGRSLFDALVERIAGQCRVTTDDARRYQMISQLIALYDYAAAANFEGHRDLILKFSADTFPELLEKQSSHYSYLISRMSAVIGSRIGGIEALAFLLERVENYPSRIEVTHDNAWQSQGSNLAHTRVAAVTEADTPEERERLATLEARLLPIVLRELRADLLRTEHQNQSLYSHNHYGFWNEKKAEFRKVAERVLEAHQDGPRILVRVARYLHDGLGESSRAIEVLASAEKRGLLDDGGLDLLVDCLHRAQRWEESIALLQPYLKRRPGEMSIRVLLIRAYHHAELPDEATALIVQTDEYFHLEGRWIEGNIIQLARVTAEAAHYERAAGYFEEAISLHQRSATNQGIGQGPLSSYYAELAAVYSQLGDTNKAVDAAAAAVVSRGPDQSQRHEAVASLKNVLEQAQDLDRYVQSLDDQAEREETDSPLIRKAIGQVYSDRGDHARAIEQLSIAVELQPYDREVHQLLLASYDAQGDSEGAIRQLLAQIDFDRHHLELYKSLAERAQGNDALAERAATSLVESAPNEAETHRALAELRETQERWDEAIAQWNEVAALRRLEPTGLLGLAKAQLQAKRWDAARTTLSELRRKEWPAHFGNVDQEVRNLERRLPQP